MGERATLGQFSFNGGELSARLQARPDQAVYQVACAGMLGYLPLLQGPAIAAPGTRYVNTAAGPCRLIPFEYNPTQGYVIEASANLFRFYTNNVRLEIGGAPVEVAHDYTYAEILELDYCQSADVLYLASAARQPQKLSRLGAANFALTDLDLRGGPIGPGNNDEDITVTVSATTGTITITASDGIFDEGDVGGFFEIEAKDFSDVASWEPGMIVQEGDLRTWAGRVYECTDIRLPGVFIDCRTGGVPPEHDEGEEWDGSGKTDVNGKGPYGVKWLYLYNRYGLAKITAYTSPTEVTATVEKRFADSLVDTASWKWAFGAFSTRRGWPETIGLWNDCLVLTKGNEVYPSVIGDYENFERRDSAGDFQRDLAGRMELPAPHHINWQAADRMLLIGTATGEYTIERMQIQSGTPGPPVFEIRLQATNGSRRTKPVQADGRILFLQRAGRKLRQLGYALQSDRYEAPDMTRLAEHIGSEGFVEMAWQAEPERLVWVVREDGSLAAMTYDPSQEVMGWCRRPLADGLLARSICRVTDPQGELDQIWIAVETEAGEALVLRMEKVWEQGDDPTDQFFVDAGLTYDGDPADEISGLGHLEGQEVQILADGKVHRNLTVADGAVTLDYEASKVHVGLGYDAWLQPLPPDGGQHEGVGLTKIKRVLAADISVIDTQGIRIVLGDNVILPAELRTRDDAMDEAVPLYTGIIHMPLVGTFDRLASFRIERFQPVNSCIAAIVRAVEVGEM